MAGATGCGPRAGGCRRRSRAIPGLTDALTDAHLDVRKAAVLSLTRWAGETAARDALGFALNDSDADVRAYARRALEGALSLY